MWSMETALEQSGVSLVAGVDEVGRGPLAGPVVAAAVILPADIRDHEPWINLRDSKRIAPRRREALNDAILELAVAVSIGCIHSAYIDEYNILQATREAMRQAVCGLVVPPGRVLIDAVTVPGLPWPAEAVPSGDSRCGSIAAASIVAKVYRDRLMIDFDRLYPHYGFARHKGYGTRQHLEALAHKGPCPIHRLSFKPLSQREAR